VISVQEKSKTHPFVSIVVLSYNSSKLGKTFRECLESVLKTEYPAFEVLLVDNGSSDSAAKDAFAELSPRNLNLRFVRLERNLGFTGGNNAGFDNITPVAEYAAFVNDDVIVAPHWLTPLVEAANSDKGVAAVGPTGSYMALGLTTVTLSERNRLSHPNQVGYVNGHCIVVKCAMFRKIRGFNPNFFIYNDEVDLCERLRSISGTSRAVPPNSVKHAQLPITNAKLSSKLFWDSRNMFFLMYQSYPAEYIPLCIALMLFNRGRRCLSLLASRNLGAFIATARGCLAGLAQMKKGVTQYGRRPFRDRELLPVTVDLLHIVLPGSLARPVVDSIILAFHRDRHL
jgi:GT2 family glycosyltransferase